MVGRDGFQPVGERERLRAEEVELVEEEEERVLMRGYIFAVRISQDLKCWRQSIASRHRSSLVTVCVLLPLQKIDEDGLGMIATWK